MSYDPGWPALKDELLTLAHDARDWETVFWLAAIAECFDGGDFDIEDFSALRWRLDVLRERVGYRNVGRLVDLCQAILDSQRTKARNETNRCGDLARNAPPQVAA